MPANTFEHRPPRTWLQITITAAREMAEPLTAFLAELTGSGIEIQDGKPDAPPPATLRIIGYLAADQHEKIAELKAYAADLHNRFPGLETPEIDSQPLVEEDWGSTWKEHFKPVRISRRLIVKPSWEPFSPAADEIVVEVDPGMAFGTGLHASTKMALELIEECFAPDSRETIDSMLDVGTGTGSLAISAVRFGAGTALALDNDPDAVAAALENVRLNHVQDRLQVRGDDLNHIADHFDLIAANIIHDTLVEMASSLCDRLAPAGRLILAGILQGKQADHIQEIYQGLGLQLDGMKTMDEWASFRFRRPGVGH